MAEANPTPRFDWTRDEIAALYTQPLDALMGQALAVKSANWADGKVQKAAPVDQDGRVREDGTASAFRYRAEG